MICLPQIFASFTLLALMPAFGTVSQFETPALVLTRIEGAEPTQGVAYVRILQDGKLLAPTTSPVQSAPPRLIAQCTRSKTGVIRFELRMTFGGVSDVDYHLPWRKSYEGHVSPAPPEKTDVTFEFIGYTKVRPMKRQWEMEREPEGELLYLAPAMHSHNLEETSVYLRYLAALPTLRLSHSGQVAEFQCAAWLAAAQKEPLCIGAANT